MLTGKELGAAIECAIEKKGVKKADVARAFGIKPPSVTSWIKTGRVAKEHLGKLVEYFSDVVEPAHFGMEAISAFKDVPRPRDHEISGIHAPRLWSSSDPLPEDEYTFAPYLKETEFTGGSGSFEIPDYNGFRLPFGKSTLYRKGIQPAKVFCCTLNGDSMEPRIDEGAAIGVNTGDTTIKDGKIYAFRHDDLFRVKYLHRLPGGRVLIKSQNDYYPDEEVGLEEIEVIGRVFWWGVLD